MTTIASLTHATTPEHGLGDRALRGLLALVFVVAGVLKLAAVDFEVQGFAHFGYAPWFMYLIGVVECAGGLALLRPWLAAPAALSLAPVMVGAIGSHLRAGDPVPTAVPAAILLLLLGWVALRHATSLRHG